jgi:hypothetical protein
MAEHKLHIEKGGFISKEHLLAYLNGELNDAENKRIEKLLADDPFLKDAIDGLRGENTNQIKNTLDKIYQDVDIIVGNKKPFTITTTIRKYAAAAMILVFFGMTFLIMNQLNKSNSDMDIALEPSTETGVQPDGENDGMGGGDTQPENTNQTNNDNLENKVVHQQRINSTQDNNDYINISEAEAPATSDSDDFDNVKYVAPSVAEDVLYNDDLGVIESKSSTSTVTTGGQIAVAYKSVYTSGIVMITDEMVAVETVVLDKKRDKKEKTESISDKPASAESEETDESLDVGITAPSYPNGIDALSIYLFNNIDQTKIGNAKGVIVVQFYINNRGQASVYKIAESLGAESDKEITRVINKMSNWEPAKQGNKKLTVLVQMPIIIGN